MHGFAISILNWLSASNCEEINQFLVFNPQVLEKLSGVTMTNSFTQAEKLDKYEADIAKYRDKLEDMEYLKNRVKELKNHNDQLMEMNELLKEELVSSEQINKAMIGACLPLWSLIM